MPTSLTGYSPDNVMSITASPGVSWQYEYENAINSYAYRLIFPNQAGYFSITFKYRCSWGAGPGSAMQTYNVFIAP